MGTKSITLNQGRFAEILGVDRTRIHAWQSLGLPFIPGPRKGCESQYIVPLAIHWHFGRKMAKKPGWRVPLRDCLDAIAFGHALVSREGGNLYSASEVVADLKRCNVHHADDYPQRLGYYTHLVEHRSGV